MHPSLNSLTLNLALLLWTFAGLIPCVNADVGDPQIRTDHPWYPGELACSTFERLFATEAEQFERATGVRPVTDEQKALAAWFWRNTHYAHGEEGPEDIWGLGFTKGDLRTREYWTGLFAHGFGLCGTTHSQFTAEMEQLLGHGRARGVGVQGHNSFEVWLTGGSYGPGRWALLDHDISTVIYEQDGKRLLSIPEIKADLARLTDRKFSPEKQHGWLVCGLDAGDGCVYREYTTSEYLAGYAGPPPMVHLRRGETLRRFLEPGLEDGKTFVFWGRNYKTAGIPGPERSQTWVNQPEKMFGSRIGTGYKQGQARFANAVYTYKPNFKNGDYREGLIEESGKQLTFEFYTPYVIAATPPNDKPWGIYDPGCRNGLILNGKATCKTSLSVDQGATWKDLGAFRDGMDVTDYVKGHRQYFLRFEASAQELENSEISVRTVCQTAVGILPRLKDNDSAITFAASHRGTLLAGPTKLQAARHIVAGKFDSPAVTLQLASPRGESVTGIYASAHVASGNPPSKDTLYQIDYSVDDGRNWKSLVKDWSYSARGQEPGDFWSQSFCYGSAELSLPSPRSVQVRFRNNGGKKYLRAEATLVYKTPSKDGTRVTFDWNDSAGHHTDSHRFAVDDQSPWQIKTGKDVRTRWVEFAVAE
jgi:hypothetical protein